MKPPKNWNGCGNCAHIKNTQEKGFHCVAFPLGIPIAFASGDIPHVSVIPGQTGKTVWAELQS
jgi:hypothetical protein